mgnify:FL=1
MKTFLIHPDDSVEILLEAGVCNGTPVPAGHKRARRAVAAGEAVYKYGWPIGRATRDIAPGDWVHSHNLATDLKPGGRYTYAPDFPPLSPAPPEDASRTFPGFLREDGRAGTRNEIWILPTVGCVAHTAQRIAAQAAGITLPGCGGVFAFPHPYGCSQLGEDLDNTRNILAALARHPNAGGALILGLGCENNRLADLRRQLEESGPTDRLRFLSCQDEEDEIAAGLSLIGELGDRIRRDKRQPLSLRHLTLGLKCGGSDGLSGLTANPLVGLAADRVVQAGGTVLLTEVPEMFGAEPLLFQRCASREVFDKAVAMITDFQQYYVRHGQPIYENPSPGNREGGITTLEEKSLGCTQKSGRSPVTDVLAYGQSACRPGLQLLSGPGNDPVACTALTAAGANLILFTTGRGTPFGAPVPTMKIATNHALYRKKPNWLDFDAQALLEAPAQSVTDNLLNAMLDAASGAPLCNERGGYRELALFKSGVTL